MLPSMPSLMTPVKELVEDSSDSSEDSPGTQHLAETNKDIDNNFVKDTNTTDEEPNVSHNHPPEESSTEENLQVEAEKINDKLFTPEKRSLSEPSSAQKKKKKTQHKKMLAALTPESSDSLEKSAQCFAEAFFKKVRSKLDDEKWGQFIQELVDFEERSDQQPTELYRRMEALLSPHVELVDEFLTCLLPHQALQIDRFIPFLMRVNMHEFIRKLSILLMKRQVRQVLSALESLVAQSNVTLADAKAAILPLLKTSPLLTNHFLELLPGERPPDSLMTDFEQMDFKDESCFETIVVPDCPDPYGNDNCICSCHNSHQKTTRHCVSCGIKYLNGRVYLQYGKVLRPAKVSFNGPAPSRLRAWDQDKHRPRHRFLPKAMLSPLLHLHLHRSTNADSEEDCGTKKSPRTPRIRTARPKTCKKVAGGCKEEEALEGIFPLVEPKHVIMEGNLMGELIVDCEMKQDNHDDHEFDEIVLENDCNTEEDDEDDKLHSENESSLEGEDIAKELESGNDCSFEDEEIEDIEINEDAQCYANLEERINDIYALEPTSFMETDQCDNPSANEDDSENKQNQTNKHTNKDEKLETSQIVKKENDSPGSPHKNSQIVKKENDSPGSPHKNTKHICNNEVDFCALQKENITRDEINITDDCGPNCSNVKQEEESVSDMRIEANNDYEKSFSVPESSSKDWTREEDKIILQAFQRENGLEQAFEMASIELPSRTKEEIQNRFDFVLKLLKEMISDESNSNT